MIVDTSAIIAILRGEPEAERFLDLIEAHRPSAISAGSWIELGAVLSRFGEPALEVQFLELVRATGMQVAPVDAHQAEIGRKAYMTYGKGRDPARLNFGDCFAYALSKATGRPLLYKGNDFSQTDIAAA